MEEQTFMTNESLFYKKVETGLNALIENELLEIVFDEYSHHPSIKFGESSTIRIRFIPVFQGFEITRIIEEPYEQDICETTCASSVNVVLRILFSDGFLPTT